MTFPSTYFGPIYYIHSLLKQENPIIIEAHEHFVKQTYRNRMRIYASNGPLDLVIPVKHTSSKVKMQDIEIDYSQSWAKSHWRSLYSSYKKSAYFEHYESYLYPLYQNPPKLLLDFNNQCLLVVLKLLKKQIQIEYTSNYQAKTHEKDWRLFIDPTHQQKIALKPYYQLFADKYGFASNLSILDLIFTLGPDTNVYLGQEIKE